MTFREWINKFGRSSVNKWFGGICGGLEAGTGLPAWIWRLLFIVLFCFLGTGLLLYILLWIILPAHRFTETDMQSFIHNGKLVFKRRDEESLIAGICSGLAVVTKTPAWIFRLIFILLTFATFAGAILYLLLWISVPKENSIS